MLINLVNNTGFNNMKIQCDGCEYALPSRGLVTVDVNRNFSLRILTQEKNQGLFDFFCFLLNGFIDEESVVNVVHYDAEFDLVAEDTEFIKTISIDQLEARNDKSGFAYFSVYLNSPHVYVTQTRYLPTDTKKQKRKSMFYLTCVASAMWLVLPVIFAALVSEYYILLLASLLFVPYWTIPALKKASKLKTLFAEDTIISALKEKEIEYNNNNGGPAPYVPDTLLGKMVDKTVNKALDKIFKKK